MNLDNYRKTRQETIERRKSQCCKTYEVKIDKSRLSKTQKELLARLFLEAKWFYNYLISLESVFDVDLKNDKISVINKDKQFEEKELLYLSHNMKYNVKQNIVTSIRGLRTLKKKHKKIGKLKFKSSVNYINLSRFEVFDNSIKIERAGRKRDRKTEKNYVFKVRGLKQVPESSEITNIRLIRKHGDYYFKVTTFQEKKNIIKTNNIIGIDLGVKDTVNFSNGIKIDVNIPINDKIKKLQRYLSKKQKSSKNRFKLRLKLQKAFEKQSNQRIDICNKVVSYLNNNFDTIAIQDDDISCWHMKWPKKISSSITGRILDRTKKLSKTVVVDRFFPSTKLCPECNSKNILCLSDRVFKCKNCEFEEDRDVKAAKMILVEGLKNKNVPVVYGDLKLMENETTALMLDYFKTLSNVKVSFVQ
jgi:putative transposase